SQRRMQGQAFEVFREDDAFDRLPTPQIFASNAIRNNVRNGRAIRARRILRSGAAYGVSRQTAPNHQRNYPSDAFNPNRQACSPNGEYQSVHDLLSLFGIAGMDSKAYAC